MRLGLDPAALAAPATKAYSMELLIGETVLVFNVCTVAAVP